MKKMIASAGWVALGTAALHAAYVPGLTSMETSKPWSVSASLRGFYDDNYAALPASSPGKKSSFGMEIRPSVGLNVPLERTLIEADYTYSLKNYWDRENDPLVHYHEFQARVSHKFSERYKMKLEDSFVYSQEPSLIDTVTQTTYRTGVNAYRNRAALAFDGQFTERLGVEIGYENQWYDYLDSGPGSVSSQLDRWEHYFNIDPKWRFTESLTGLVGYKYGIVSYTSKEPIDNVPGALLASVRDTTAHYLYGGVEYQFSTKLTVAARGGVQLSRYENTGKDFLNPYVNISGTYTYLPGSYLQAGFRNDRAATDLVGDSTNPETVTLDQAASTFYAYWAHKFTQKITGSLLGQVQYSSFQGGTFDGETETSYLLNLSVEYALTKHFSAEFGYIYETLVAGSNASFDRGYSRNQVYMGVRASY